MSNSSSKEELEKKPKALDQTLESGNDPTDSQKIYEVIVAGGENKNLSNTFCCPPVLYPRKKTC
jgi:hypothetical protein